MKNLWAVEWLRWPGYGQFWGQLVREHTFELNRPHCLEQSRGHDQGRRCGIAPEGAGVRHGVVDQIELRHAQPERGAEPLGHVEEAQVVVFMDLHGTDLAQGDTRRSVPQPECNGCAHHHERHHADHRRHRQAEDDTGNDCGEQRRQHAQRDRSAPIGRHFAGKYLGSPQTGLDDPRRQRLGCHGHRPGPTSARRRTGRAAPVAAGRSTACARGLAAALTRLASAAPATTTGAPAAPSRGVADGPRVAVGPGNPGPGTLSPCTTPVAVPVAAPGAVRVAASATAGGTATATARATASGGASTRALTCIGALVDHRSAHPTLR